MENSNDMNLLLLSSEMVVVYTFHSVFSLRGLVVVTLSNAFDMYRTIGPLKEEPL